MNELDLSLREKELRCLLDLSRLVETPGIELDSILAGTVQILPPAMKYPEISYAQLTLMDHCHQTANFKMTGWRLSSPVKIHGDVQGTLTVGYLEARPPLDEGPFALEKRNLLDAVAERIGKIVERKLATTALAKSEKRLNDIVENALVGISIVQEGREVYRNPELRRLIGDVVGGASFLELSHVHPDDRKKVKSSFEALMAGQLPRVDMVCRFYPHIHQRSSLKWLYCRATQIDYRNKDAVLMNLMDISPAKEMERMLRIQDKMSSLGRVAAGIAHEIRNPLSGINIYINTLEKLIGKPEEEKKIEGILSQLKSASTKIENVIRRVYDFARPTEPQFEMADINHPIREAIDLSAAILRKKGVHVETDLAEDLPLCRFDAQLIEQVLLNLITNAAETLNQEGTPGRIGIQTQWKDDQIRIRVEDSGDGIPEDLREKIFDPFYTTKYGSSGIGLSISQRIVEDHGGTLTVRPGKWGGAEFTIMLPVSEGLT
jgi:PAS domain S-box-containing protein